MKVQFLCTHLVTFLQNQASDGQRHPLPLSYLLLDVKVRGAAAPKELMTYAWLESEYWGRILAPRNGLEPWGWNWSHVAGVGVGAGLEPWGWYWSPEAGIGALRLGLDPRVWHLSIGTLEPWSWSWTLEAEIGACKLRLEPECWD